MISSEQDTVIIETAEIAKMPNIFLKFIIVLSFINIDTLNDSEVGQSIRM
jgi:hypothetical protein